MHSRRTQACWPRRGRTCAPGRRCPSRCWPGGHTQTTGGRARGGKGKKENGKSRKREWKRAGVHGTPQTIKKGNGRTKKSRERTTETPAPSATRRAQRFSEGFPRQQQDFGSGSRHCSGPAPAPVPACSVSVAAARGRPRDLAAMDRNTKGYLSTYLAMGFANVRSGTQKTPRRQPLVRSAGPHRVRSG